MPSAQIELRKKWSRPEKDRMILALHESLVECLKIPEHDKLIRLREYQPEDFIVPPGYTENYALIEISLFSGRSLDAKRVLYRTIVARFAELGIAKGDIRIILYEVPAENWGIRGGIPASEVDLGFNVEV
jgi:phenylpyruvate tautomerase PptA (4-oxalocrotonate tautomerase family)